MRALGLLQIDSVNVLVRSHYLPLFSRLGAYAMPLLDAAAYGGRRRQVFEYWGHEASLLPVEFWSSTLDAVSPANAWALRVESDGAAGTTISRVSRALASSATATCVRGPASGVSWL